MYLVLEVSTFGGLVVTTYIHTLQGASLAFIAVCIEHHFFAGGTKRAKIMRIISI